MRYFANYLDKHKSIGTDLGVTNGRKLIDILNHDKHLNTKFAKHSNNKLLSEIMRTDKVKLQQVKPNGIYNINSITQITNMNLSTPKVLNDKELKHRFNATEKMYQKNPKNVFNQIIHVDLRANNVSHALDTTVVNPNSTQEKLNKCKSNFLHNDLNKHSNQKEHKFTPKSNNPKPNNSYQRRNPKPSMKPRKLSTLAQIIRSKQRLYR